MGYVDRGAAERLGAELVDIVYERERDDRDFTRALALEVGASALRLLLPTMTSADREHFERDALATPHQVPEGTINSESRHFPVLLQALRLHALVIEQVYENAMRSAGVSIDSGMRSRLLDALFPQAAPSHDEVRMPFEGSAQSAASATDASPAMAGTAGGSPDASSQSANATSPEGQADALNTRKYPDIAFEKLIEKEDEDTRTFARIAYYDDFDQFEPRKGARQLDPDTIQRILAFVEGFKAG